MTPDPTSAEPARILKATAWALVAAAVILVTVVLPAEYGLDPLGTGRALGLLALADPPGPAAGGPAPPSQAVQLANDEFRIELRPFDSVEYKYRLEAQAALVYEWTASAPVEFDFHGEPDGDGGAAESYATGSGSSARGTFTAGKPGIHGWYWNNRTTGRVTVTLRTAGFYSRSITYYDGERTERPMTPKPATP
jgi:hypothetical protein